MANYPVEAAFPVAPYDDGCPRVTVTYDAKPGTCQDNIWLETGYGSNWIAFEEAHAEAVCEAIMSAANALRSLTARREPSA